jgi:mannose-1-phosphate guanylyltransferase / mannose-6-phosphate isomerase
MIGKVIPVILAGGAGERLWPVSRAQAPKQFLNLGQSQTTFDAVMTRARGDVFDACPIIVAAREHDAFLSAVTASDILLEPVRRGSCAAVVAAALRAIARDSESVIIVMASDHLITDAHAFQLNVQHAYPAAQSGALVTFGVTPTHAATGYGYLHVGEQFSGEVRRVQRFVEKPDAATAQSYIDQGYLWNSGNFLFRASAFLDEARHHTPELVAHVERSIDTGERRANRIFLAPDDFAKSPNISIDYAIMEKTDRAAVLPVTYTWSDIGTWDAVAASLSQDDPQNKIIGRGLVEKSENVLVYSQDKLTTVIGCDDLIVVTTADAVLVMKKGRGEEVKTVLETLRHKGFAEADRFIANLSAEYLPP